MFHSRGLALSCLEWGNVGAPALILLHGGMEHARSWDKVALALRTRWHVFAPDLRGHGDSQWSAGGAYSVMDFVPDLFALVAEIATQPVALVGHSLGGNIAVHFASLYPEWVSLLCAIEGLGLSPKARHKRDQTDRRQQLRDWVDTAIEADHRRRRYYRDIDSAAARIMAHDPLVDAPTALHMARHGLCPAHETGNNDLLRWKYDERLRAWGVADVASPQPKDLWGAIQCPVLLVYGAESWASNPDKDGRAAYFQSVRVEEIPKAGHNVHHHQKAKFLEVLDGFLH